MTASIIAFPDIHERNDREFDRTGSTSYTRAVDEGHELGGMPTDTSLDRPAYLRRVDALNVVVTGLATWRDEVDWTLPIRLFSGALVQVTLRDAPRFLYGLIGEPFAA